MIIVAALYKFASLPEFRDFQQPLKECCETGGVMGTLLLAEEGINGTIAGTRQAIDAVMALIRSIPSLEDLEYKESHAPQMPFYRLKVRLKTEIVTLGVSGISPLKKVGTYVAPKEWNDLISDPDVLVLDTRNDYETVMGTFQGAVDPKTKTFYSKKQSDNWNSKAIKTVTTKANAKIVNYWCFNPGFGMEQLLGSKVHSIILTSGTLVSESKSLIFYL